MVSKQQKLHRSQSLTILFALHPYYNSLQNKCDFNVTIFSYVILNIIEHVFLRKVFEKKLQILETNTTVEDGQKLKKQNDLHFCILVEPRSTLTYKSYASSQLIYFFYFFFFIKESYTYFLFIKKYMQAA